MINKGVWIKPKIRNMPPNRHLIDSKWVSKKKIYGQFRSRLVARRYTQISGVYFSENYSPVVTDVTLRVILLMWLIRKWDSRAINIETAFLYPVLEK